MGVRRSPIGAPDGRASCGNRLFEVLLAQRLIGLLPIPEHLGLRGWPPARASRTRADDLLTFRVDLYEGSPKHSHGIKPSSLEGQLAGRIGKTGGHLTHGQVQLF